MRKSDLKLSSILLVLTSTRCRRLSTVLLLFYNDKTFGNSQLSSNNDIGTVHYDQKVCPETGIVRYFFEVYSFGEGTMV